MVKLICISENNYLNFKTIIVPLICSLAEISHSLNNLISEKIISDKILLNLNKDEIIFIIFIIIINCNVPNNIINSYQKIFDINENWINYNFTMENIILDIDKIKIIDIYWYSSFLLIIILFILIYFDSHEKIPKKLIEQIDKIHLNVSNNLKINDNKNMEFILAVKPFILFIKENNLLDNENNCFKAYNVFFYENPFYFKFIINMIIIVLNIKKLLATLSLVCYKDNSFINEIFILLTQFCFDLKNNAKGKNQENINEIKNKFKSYHSQFYFLQKLFPFLDLEKDFLPQNKLLMKELIDYHGIYHQTMKELFIFNRLWSNQKLFYSDTLEERKKSNIKYKNINYYTKNFQKPIIYPILDIKNRYPEFTKFKIDDNFYINNKEEEKEKNDDNYNFDLDCPELDKIINEYNLDIYKQIENKKEIKKYNVCLIKQLYHVKGNLFVIKNRKSFIIYFFSHPYDFKNKKEDSLLCNKIKKNGDNNLCHGSLFRCHKKEKNRIIIIHFEYIRMILKRIYYYRKSAIEIFNQVKSYYFNFFSEEELNDFFDLFKSYCDNPTSYFYLNINDNLIGIIKINQKFIKENNLIKSGNNLDELIYLILNNNKNDICIFDILLLINLISNRSFMDIYQYPVFPVLFFYNKEQKIIIRDFNQHIGLQQVIPESIKRKELFTKSYKESKKELDENILDGDVFYFNTHYSNCVYISNYMIRLIPFAFLSIELQGDGFDEPNRLFFSIEKSFYNISSQKSDIRELIPEFFYFPEMFMNINNINFHKRKDNILVDDIIIPNNLTNLDDYMNIKDKDNKIDDIKEIDILQNENENKETSIRYFIFVDYMKKKLESFKNKLFSWINIIFGDEPRNKKIGKNKDQTFRTESFIDIDKDTYEEYSKDEVIMDSIEFGVIPLKTIYDNKILNIIENLKNNYDKLDEKTKNELTTIKTKKYFRSNTLNEKALNIDIKDKNIENKNNNNNLYNGLEVIDKDYFGNKLNINFRIDNNDNFGKLEIDLGNNFICKIIDHNDKIIDIFYNKRLNMFATSSLDGTACIYIFPNKLFSIIKQSNNFVIDKIFLSSNPFPTIITFEKKNKILRSYSLSGILIREKVIEINDCKGFEINPIFNTCGGGFIDRIKINNDSNKFYKIYNLPFFDEYIFNK